MAIPAYGDAVPARGGGRVRVQARRFPLTGTQAALLWFLHPPPRFERAPDPPLRIVVPDIHLPHGEGQRAKTRSRPVHGLDVTAGKRAAPEHPVAEDLWPAGVPGRPQDGGRRHHAAGSARPGAENGGTEIECGHGLQNSASPNRERMAGSAGGPRRPVRTSWAGGAQQVHAPCGVCTPFAARLWPREMLPSGNISRVSGQSRRANAAPKLELYPCAPATIPFSWTGDFAGVVPGVNGSRDCPESKPVDYRRLRQREMSTHLPYSARAEYSRLWRVSGYVHARTGDPHVTVIPG